MPDVVSLFSLARNVMGLFDATAAQAERTRGHAGDLTQKLKPPDCVLKSHTPDDAPRLEGMERMISGRVGSRKSHTSRPLGRVTQLGCAWWPATKPPQSEGFWHLGLSLSQACTQSVARSTKRFAGPYPPEVTSCQPNSF